MDDEETGNKYKLQTERKRRGVMKHKGGVRRMGER